MFAVRFALALTALVTTIAAVHAAPQLVDRSTKWYTIGVPPASDGARPLFLTRHQNGVDFEPYISGDAGQMWTTVADFYPGAAPVTSDSGIDIGAVLACLGNGWHGCGFSVSIPAIKVVNREGGPSGCLIAPMSGAMTAKCGTSGNLLKQEYWRMSAAGDNGSGVLTSAGGCLTAAPASARNLNLRTVAGARCGRGEQEFVVQLVDELACKTGPWQICFVNGNQP